MKLKLTFIALFITVISFAQYSKSSIEPSIGITKIQDVTPFRAFNAQLGYRHMLNTKFGARIIGGYSRLYDAYEHQGYSDPLSYTTGTLHGVVNVGRVLGFESFTNSYTILGSIGGTYTYSDGTTNNDIYHRYSNFHLSGRIDNEVKITKGLFINASLDFIKDVNNRPFVKSTETTNIININVGLVISLNHKKEHADWYIEPIKKDTIVLEPTIIDKTITNNITKECDCKVNEYVFFNHDSYTVNKDGLNAITRTSDQLKKNSVIHVIGYASPPGTDDYNMNLSRKRAEAVSNKLLSLGVKESQISVSFIGEIDTINGDNVDLSRRVQLIIIK